MRHLRRVTCCDNAIFNLRGVPLWIIFLAAIPGFTQAQQAVNRQREQLAVVPKALPSDVLQQVKALGARMQTAGKEETVLEGQLVDDAGRQKSIRVLHQLSGMVRIEGVRDHVALTFDGALTRGVTDRMDESLLETFIMDTPEGMLYSIGSGASMQLLGRSFGPDSRTVPDYAGPRYDIYQVASSVRSRNDRTLQVRRYYFDSQSGLLASTRYVDSTGSNVETRFLNWAQVDGSAYPKRVERYENRRLAFSFIVATMSGRPRQDATNFQ